MHKYSHSSLAFNWTAAVLRKTKFSKLHFCTIALSPSLSHTYLPGATILNKLLMSTNELDFPLSSRKVRPLLRSARSQPSVAGPTWRARRHTSATEAAEVIEKWFILLLYTYAHALNERARLHWRMGRRRSHCKHISHHSSPRGLCQPTCVQHCTVCATLTAYRSADSSPPVKTVPKRHVK